MLGGLSYGAKKELAQEYFDKAAEVAADSPVVYIEKARGLLTMFGDTMKPEAITLLNTALEKTPLDAMQWLDQKQAHSFLQALPTTSF